MYTTTADNSRTDRDWKVDESGSETHGQAANVSLWTQAILFCRLLLIGRTQRCLHILLTSSDES